MAILQGWGRDKGRTGSLGACLLLRCPPHSFMYSLVVPQTHLQGRETLGRMPVPSPPWPRASSGITPWGWDLGAGGRAQGSAVPLPCTLHCSPKPHPHAPSPCPCPTLQAGAAETPSSGRQSPLSREQRFGWQPGTAWEQSHGQGSDVPGRGWHRRTCRVGRCRCIAGGSELVAPRTLLPWELGGGGQQQSPALPRQGLCVCG